MISFDDYRTRLAQVEVQLGIARSAIDSEATSGVSIDAYLERQVDILRQVASSQWGDLEPSRREVVRSAAQGALDRFADVRRKVMALGTRGILVRIVQYELVIRLALFESFMKDIHRAILGAEPRLLKGTRDIKLGELVVKGIDWIISKQIESEVRSLDRLSIEKRAEYFRNRLGILWVGDGYVSMLALATDTRNQLLHQECDTDVPPRVMEFSKLACFGILHDTIVQGHLLWPEVFSRPLDVSDTTLKLYADICPGLVRRRNSDDKD